MTPTTSADPPGAGRRPGWLVRLDLVGAVAPPGCACCGAPDGGSDVVRGGSGDVQLIVGYCDECRRHQGVERARLLAGALASALVALGLGVALPLASRPLPPSLLAALALVGSLVPVIVVALFPRRAGPGHAAAGPAVRPARGGLSCARERWARELARLNGVEPSAAPFRERRVTLALLLAPLLAPLAVLAVLAVASPVVRVVNLSGERIRVEVDGSELVTLDPTSVESPVAGAEVRLGIGSHELVARAPDGRVLERARVSVEAFRTHLFAPASGAHCFWLETSSYGRSGGGPSAQQPFEGPPHFWALPADLGGFFTPPPEALLSEARFTGGLVTVLRQAPCEATP